MKTQKASEDYLEAMLMMREKHGYIRSIDVAEQIGVTKPSVSYATKRLRENGYITMDHDGLITLTEKGQARAYEVSEEHGEFVKDFFAGLTEDEKLKLLELLKKASAK